MNRIANLFKKDLLLGIKDVFVLLEIGFAVVYVFLLLFVIPEDIERDATVYVYDETKVVENFLAETIGLKDIEERMGEFYVDSRDAIIEGMTEERSAIGLTITGGANGTYNVELLTQPYTTDAWIRYIDIDLEDLLALISPPYNFYPANVRDSVRVEALQWGLRDELPFNQRLLAPAMLMMVGVLGLFIMISLIAQERLEATIRAFRISPAGLGEFLLSKHLLLLTIGFTTFTILYLPIIGFSGYLSGLAVILLTVLFGSSLGVILGGFFDTPMSAMLWVFLLLIVLGLPAVSLFSPVFSPEWLKIIPSYHTLFGLDAAMFPDNNRHVIGQSIAVLGGLDVVLLGLSTWIFNSKISKEA
jgi:hypothetical protein